MTGEHDERGEDIEMLGATKADFDFVANARQDIPKLLYCTRDKIVNDLA